MSDTEAEQRGWAASSALELAETAYLVPASNVDISGDIEEYDLDYLLDVNGYLEALQSAVRTVRRQLQQVIASRLEGVSYYRHRDQIVRPGQGGTWKVRDANAMRDWINDNDAWEIVNVAAPGAITITRLKQYLAAVGMTPEAAETFMHREPSGGPITILRPEDAPKKAQALKHGESLAAKRLENK